MKVDHRAESGTDSNIVPESYKKLLRRETLYPLKVLKCKIDRREENEIPGYVRGAELDVVKCFRPMKGKKEAPVRWWREDGQVANAKRDSRAGGGIQFESVEELIDGMQSAFTSGVMRPDPIGAERGDARGKWMPEVCGDCHLQSACRFHLLEEPVDDGQGTREKGK